MLLFWIDVEDSTPLEQSRCPAVNWAPLALAPSLMQQFGKFAIGLAALLAIGVAVNARWGDSFKDPSPAARQMREQFEAIEKSAGLPMDRHGCETLHKFVPTQPFFYQCPVTRPELDALRPVLATRGWQPAAPTPDVGYGYVKGALRTRLSCDAQGAACVFRIETTPPAAGG
jgi:hypothetical protein